MPKVVYSFDEVMDKLQNGEFHAVRVTYGSKPKSTAFFQNFDGAIRAYMPANAGEQPIEQDVAEAQNTLSLISQSYKIKIDTL